MKPEQGKSEFSQQVPPGIAATQMGAFMPQHEPTFGAVEAIKKIRRQQQQAARRSPENGWSVRVQAQSARIHIAIDLICAQRFDNGGRKRTGLTHQAQVMNYQADKAE